MVSGKEHRKAFIKTYSFNIQTNLKEKMWNLHKMQNWILSELHEPMPWCEWLQIGGMQLIQHSEQDLFSGMPICCPRFILFFRCNFVFILFYVYLVINLQHSYQTTWGCARNVKRAPSTVQQVIVLMLAIQP